MPPCSTGLIKGSKQQHEQSHSNMDVNMEQMFLSHMTHIPGTTSPVTTMSTYLHTTRNLVEKNSCPVIEWFRAISQAIVHLAHVDYGFGYWISICSHYVDPHSGWLGNGNGSFSSSCVGPYQSIITTFTTSRTMQRNILSVIMTLYLPRLRDMI